MALGPPHPWDAVWAERSRTIPVDPPITPAIPPKPTPASPAAPKASPAAPKASPAAPKAVPQKSMPRPGTRPKGTGNPADAAAGSAAGPPMTKVSLCKGSFLSE